MFSTSTITTHLRKIFSQIYKKFPAKTTFTGDKSPIDNRLPDSYFLFDDLRFFLTDHPK